MSEGGPILGRGKALLEQLISMLQNRLELLAVEIEQEKVYIGYRLRLAVTVAIFVWLAGFTLVLWVALVLPPTLRLYALGILFVVFLVVSILSWLALRRSARREPLFSRVIGQLRLDRASLGNKP
jgi:uncharacterized membrane protein YqjE